VTGRVLAEELLAPRPAERLVVPPAHRPRYWRLGSAAHRLADAARGLAANGEPDAAAIVSDAETKLRGLMAAMRVPESTVKLAPHPASTEERTA
jgi:hypothetical protein